MIECVVGFMFNRDKSFVVLIEKKRPAWQAGKLNGVGGKIELGESPIQAMVREFHEEIGFLTIKDDWIPFGILKDDRSYIVHLFWSVKSLERMSWESPTDEPVWIVSVEKLIARKFATINNLPWLVSIALDSMDDNHPEFVYIEYQNRK